MKRILTTALSALLLAVLLGVTGCDSGGGVPEGMPEPGKVDIPLDKMKDMANMQQSGTPPPSTTTKPMPGKGADAGATPPAEEKK